MSDTVERIKEKITIVEVVQPYVKLTRAGKYWKGLSPFTKEKTPSFFVSPDRGLYHCFSTGKGGDMFTFLQEMEGVDFKGALKLLADKAGVPLVYEKGNDGERDLILKALESAKNFFVHNLKEHADVQKYLVSRGLSEKTIEDWKIGYALPEWRTLYEALTGSSISEAILERAGLVKKPDAEEGKENDKKVDDRAKSEEVLRPAGRMYDRFRGRVMFPIEDISGRIIGFSGRLLKDDEKHPQAKYLNSPETPVFDKSRALYGISHAREGIRGLGAAILVEGQLDLLMSHQAGYKNTIATSGTSFTAGHAELIRRYTPNLLIAYDGDRAGIAAAGRAAGIALGAGMNVKIAKFPAGQDPADLLLKSPDVFKTAVKEAMHVVDFYIAHITDAKYDPRTFRLEVSRTVLPYVGMIQNKIDQAHFIKRVAEVLSVPEEAVKAELSKLETSGVKADGPEMDRKMQGAPLPAEPFLSRADAIERLVVGLMLLFKERGTVHEAEKAEQALREAVGEERLRALLESGENRAALFEADFFLERHDTANTETALADMYADLVRESTHEKYRETLTALRAAEKSFDTGKAEELMHELNRLALTLK
jgi:DNA primase